MSGFSHFLSRLRQEGFIIGVEHYLKAVSVLKTFGPHSVASELKYLLCPIFATNAKQQEQFYRFFEQYFPNLTLEKRKEESPEYQKEEPLRVRKWPYMVMGFIVILIISLIPHKPKPTQTKTTITTIPVSDTQRRPDIRITIPIKAKQLVQLTWYQQYGHSVRVGAASVPVVVFIVFLIWRYEFARLVLQRQSLKKPPLVWPIVVEPPEPDYLKNQAF